MLMRNMAYKGQEGGGKFRNNAEGGGGGERQHRRWLMEGWSDKGEGLEEAAGCSG